MKTLLPLGSRRRWRVAYWLNRLPGMCWTNLVEWALTGLPLRQTPLDSVCRADAAACGCLCYCAKIRPAGMRRAS